MQWHTQDENIINNLRFTLDFTLPALSATNFVTWKCHGYDSAKGGYNIILGRDILTGLVLNLKRSEHVIKNDNGPFKGSKTPMVDLGIYIYIKI